MVYKCACFVAPWVVDRMQLAASVVASAASTSALAAWVTFDHQLVKHTKPAANHIKVAVDCIAFAEHLVKRHIINPFSLGPSDSFIATLWQYFQKSLKIIYKNRNKFKIYIPDLLF